MKPDYKICYKKGDSKFWIDSAHIEGNEICITATGRSYQAHPIEPNWALRIFKALKATNPTAKLLRFNTGDTDYLIVRN